MSWILAACVNDRRVELLDDVWCGVETCSSWSSKTEAGNNMANLQLSMEWCQNRGMFSGGMFWRGHPKCAQKHDVFCMPSPMQLYRSKQRGASCAKWQCFMFHFSSLQRLGHGDLLHCGSHFRGATGPGTGSERQIALHHKEFGASGKQAASVSR